MKYRITTPQSQGFWEARITQSLQSFQFTQHLTKMGTPKNHAPLVSMRIANHLTCATRDAPGTTLEMFKSSLRFGRQRLGLMMAIGNRTN